VRRSEFVACGSGCGVCRDVALGAIGALDEEELEVADASS
jgi:bacterioferritin-associated ferredoxin